MAKRQTKKNILRSIMQFSSTQEYLVHYIAFRKELDSNFGYRKFADECGLKSLSYLQMVVKGQRVLSLDCVHRIAEAAKLSFAEHSYLENLALLDAATSKSDRSYYKRKLRDLVASSAITDSAQVRRIPSDKNVNWKLIPLIALLASAPESFTLAELTKRLDSSAGEMQDQIDTLVKMGLAYVEEDLIKIDLQSVALHDPKDFKGLQKNILRELLSFSTKAFEKSYDHSKFYSHSFTADPKRIPELNEEIHSFFSNLTDLGSEHKSSQIVQVNLQCFDLFNVVR